MKGSGRRTTDMALGHTNGRTDEYSKANLHKTDFLEKLKQKNKLSRDTSINCAILKCTRVIHFRVNTKNSFILGKMLRYFNIFDF